jgi:multidrug resistance efflux pump
MPSGRAIRVTAALVVLAGAVWVLAPHIISDLRSNGVVNARIVIVRAPIGGLMAAEPPEVGSKITLHDQLAEIIDGTESLSLLAQLDQERELIRGRIDALEGKMAALTSLYERLSIRISQFSEQSGKRLVFIADEARAREKAWSAVVEERRSHLGRISKLSESGHATKAQLETAKTTLEQALQEVARATADRQRVEQEIKALGKGVILGEGRDDVSYSQQRLDDIVVSRADLQIQLSEAESKLRAVDRQYELEILRSEQRNRGVVKAPINGLVWRRIATQGTTVAKESEIARLLDCSKLYIEVPISENAADDVAIGSTVKMRLQGSREFREGQIHDIRGPRSVTPADEWVSQRPQLKRDEVLVTIQTTVEKLGTRVTNFCGVGRRVEVAFPRAGGILPAIRSLF